MKHPISTSGQSSDLRHCVQVKHVQVYSSVGLGCIGGSWVGGVNPGMAVNIQEPVHVE